MATVLPSRLQAATAAFELQMKRRRVIAVIALVLLLEQSLIGISPFANWTISYENAGGDALRQVLIVGILGFQLLAPANARPPMPIPVSLVVLLGYCLLSCTWAIDPGVSLRRLGFTTVVIVILVRAIGDLGAVRTLGTVRIAMAVLLAINFLTVMFSPYGVHMATVTEDQSVIGDWRGIVSHKNVAGACCAITILLFAFDRDRLPRWVTVSVIAGSFVFLLMSEAKTSIGILFVAVIAGGVLHLYNARHRSLVVPIFLIAGFAFFCVVMMYSGLIQDLLDDPTAFTGRTAIWPLLLEYSGEHLWTGAGYMSFWQIGPESPIWTLTNSWVAAAAGHGHNGYLDILVTIGLPGLILTVAVLFVWPAVRLLYSTGISRPRRALLGSLMVFSAGHNMMESTLLDRASIVHVFLMVSVILIHRLSNQSAGAHQALRARMTRLADGAAIKRLRARARQVRRRYGVTTVASPQVEDRIA